MLLGAFRVKAWIAGLASLGVALIVALLVYDVPLGQSVNMGLEGAAFGLFPIMWIVINAVWIYNMTERTGHFAVLRRSFATISDDQRIQAIIIAFSFGALIEGLAGFGTPVAITSVMLLALGFSPMKAAALSLIGNTAPVAFGSIATPIITLGAQTELPVEDLGAMVGRQTPFLALIVPLILVGVVDGARGVRQTWPAALVAGISFAIAQFVCSNYISVELTDLIAALVSTAALVGFLRVWRPSEPLLVEPPGRRAAGDRRRGDRGPGARAQRPPARPGDGLDAREVGGVRALHHHRRRLRDREARRPGRAVPVRGLRRHRLRHRREDAQRLRVAGPRRHARPRARRRRPRRSSSRSGTRRARCVLFCGLLTIAALRINLKDALKTYGETLDQLKFAIITVMAVLGLAYVMNLTGMTTTLGRWVAGSGSFFAFLSSLVGWLGVAITGSDTSSNALFGALQVEAAKEAGLNETLLASANSSGGVLGKMISPQNLAICAAAVGLAGKEGDIFRRVLLWSDRPRACHVRHRVPAVHRDTRLDGGRGK